MAEKINYKELLNTVLQIQKELIENSFAFQELFSKIIPIPHSSNFFYFLLNEDGINKALDFFEVTTIRTKENVKEENGIIKEVLSNFTVNQNLRTGFTLEEYFDLVEYVVITQWRSIFGKQITETYDNTKPNNKQLIIINHILKYPNFLTVLLLEQQVFLFSKRQNK